MIDDSQQKLSSPAVKKPELLTCSPSVSQVHRAIPRFHTTLTVSAKHTEQMVQWSITACLLGLAFCFQTLGVISFFCTGGSLAPHLPPCAPSPATCACVWGGGAVPLCVYGGSSRNLDRKSLQRLEVTFLRPISLVKVPLLSLPSTIGRM